MRVEPFATDSYVHVLKRGGRGMSIVNDDADRWRFVRLLYYVNDVYANEWWERDTKNLGIFGRPDSWPERKPLVKILGYTLMSNHFHLFLKEINKGGISKFMQRLCGSMTRTFNEKYDQKGSIFQGAYKARTVNDDEYMRYLAVYIMVKNPFELYPGGWTKAIRTFNDAYDWATRYPFSSLADYAGERDHSQILDKDILGEIFQNPRDLKNFAKDCIEGIKLREISLE
ncbi:MAG: hypothetical protein A2664_00090 [Candidatus Taylorbacteria bacterium RIFCSPHIGHO2_01_FULL_46_22b]|uniref:Transposase IS200-like domain-containing protein n=1 Tax=Candidatus Taylorbacteria bacterium RIFCSPHIGHO2_01_FULL_46_22b TaxID=1802301 RepID=A0A1G2M1S8_9BACT|nr:MAG: hypothetical protein A2664_00090 [Candidatus Taylorbacteria bacterium RIFCSPHIGHO2_01_FULL_46_22b]